VDVKKPWETIRENIKISAKDGLCYCELKKHMEWFDQGCSKLLGEKNAVVTGYKQNKWG
jgi:hypothetical protein